jgi:hypothetical protein
VEQTWKIIDDVRIATLLTSLRALGHGLEGFGLESSVLLEQDLYLTFRFIQLLAAGGGKLHSFFEKDEGLFERNFAFFQILDNFVEALEALFKLGQRKLL